MTLTRRSVALLAVAAVLALLNLWGARDVAVVEALPTLPAVLPDSVAVLQISTPVEKLRLERLSTDEASPELARWRIVTPLQFPADAAQVRSLLRAFESGLAMDAHVDGGNHEDYGVDDQSGLLVELFAADADVPAAALVVGKPASGPSAFVRIPGSDDVYRADVGGRAKYARPAAEWRDRVALEIDVAAVTGLTLARGDERLVFARGPSAGAGAGGADDAARAGAWRLEGAPFATDTETVDATIRALARVRAVEVHNPDYAAGFDAPAGTATLALADGTTRTITLGGRLEEKAAFVKVDGRDEVFRVAANVGRAVLQGPEAFRDRRLLAFERADVAAVAYVDGGLTVVLSQGDEGAWAVTQPPNMDADQQLALFTVNTLATLRAAAIPTDPAFAPSGARFEVRFRDGSVRTVELGPAERFGEGPALVRVRVSGREGVYLLQEALVVELRKAFGRG